MINALKALVVGAVIVAVPTVASAAPSADELLKFFAKYLKVTGEYVPQSGFTTFYGTYKIPPALSGTFEDKVRDDSKAYKELSALAAPAPSMDAGLAAMIMVGVSGGVVLLRRKRAHSGQVESLASA